MLAGWTTETWRRADEAWVAFRGDREMDEGERDVVE